MLELILMLEYLLDRRSSGIVQSFWPIYFVDVVETGIYKKAISKLLN
jgi:hypothetical protein